MPWPVWIKALYSDLTLIERRQKSLQAAQILSVYWMEPVLAVHMNRNFVIDQWMLFEGLVDALWAIIRVVR